MKKIALTQGKFALVDDEDFEALAHYKWQATCSNDSFRKKLKWYACRWETIKFKTRPSKRRKVYMHRLVMHAPRGKVIDHLDGDGLNNQKSNLRAVTPYQNVMNRIGGHGGCCAPKDDEVPF